MNHEIAKIADETTLRKLEFDRVRVAIADCCHCELGKKLARSLMPSTKTAVVRRWLRQVTELGAVVDEHEYPPLGGVHDIRDYVRASAFPAPLEPDVLASIAETLMATHLVCHWFEQVIEQAPSLSNLRDWVDDLSSIAEVINESIDARGQVCDQASRKLASIRATIESTRKKIRDTFDRILRRSSTTRMLQYGGATFHDDRMVLPLKSEYRGRIPGIVHRSSDKGSTLFVEPAESVELNNTLIRLRDEENKEIEHILRLLTQRICANHESIMKTMRGLAALDLVAGKFRYAQARSCVCVELDDHGVLDLHDARHPVLIELFQKEAKSGGEVRQVVPIDIRLGDDFDVLMVTGPNTGGKTVALKTVGLLAIMTQCGLPIPVGEGSRMPIYTQIFIDIGDEQSLQQSLSTFSSHLETLLNILRRSGPRTLVLIDELGAGTDPDEGAAIGRAVVSELLHLKAKAIVTTHLSTLKAVAYTTDRVDNASVEFDTESLRPTYHLKMGEPGNSNALIIAKRLGMPARLVKQAKSYLDDKSRALNKAIEGTIQSRRDAEQARREAREAALQSRKQGDQLRQEAAALKATQEAFDVWTKWVNTLRPGDLVFVKTLRKEAKVVRMALHQQKALVFAGAMQLELPLQDLSPLADQ